MSSYSTQNRREKAAASLFPELRPCLLEAPGEGYSASPVRTRNMRNRHRTTQTRITPLSEVLGDAEFMQKVDAMRIKREHRADFEEGTTSRDTQSCFSTLCNEGEGFCEKNHIGVLLQSVRLF